MSADARITCPNCGAIYVQIGESNGANPVQSDVQIDVKSGANDVQLTMQNGDLTKGFSPRSKTYNQGYGDRDFLAFWSVWPRKRAKGVAYKAWSNAVQRLMQMTGANRQDCIWTILTGAIAERDDPNREDEFTQHAATWLNGDGWENEPRPGGGHEGTPIRSTQVTHVYGDETCPECGIVHGAVLS